MRSKFEEQIINNLTGLSFKENKVAVALSGGADSLALTVALRNIGFNVFAILVNHHLRDEADEEIQKTIITLQKLNIKYISKDWNGKYKNNLESEARKARYTILLDVCKSENIDILCIGHHMDDQIETFLLNLLRGSGLDGLCAMPKINVINGICIVRPMLNLTKQDCKNYLKNRNIKWCEDLSNFDLKYKRNKIRYLLNKIEDKKIITKRIYATIEILQEARKALDVVIKETEEKLLQKKDNKVFFDRNDFLHLSEYLQKSILARCISQMSKKEYKPRLIYIENIIQSIKMETNFKRTISNLIISGKKKYINIEKQ